MCHTYGNKTASICRWLVCTAGSLAKPCGLLFVEKMFPGTYSNLKKIKQMYVIRQILYQMSPKVKHRKRAGLRKVRFDHFDGILSFHTAQCFNLSENRSRWIWHLFDVWAKTGVSILACMGFNHTAVMFITMRDNIWNVLQRLKARTRRHKGFKTHSQYGHGVIKTNALGLQAASIKWRPTIPRGWPLMRIRQHKKHVPRKKQYWPSIWST